MDLPSGQNATGHWQLDAESRSNASSQSSTHPAFYSLIRSGKLSLISFKI